MSDAAFSWAAAALLVCALVISGFYRHKARRKAGTIARSDEPNGLILLRVLISILFIGVLLTSIVRPWATASLPRAVRLAGFGLGVFSLPGLVWMFRSIGANISETVLLKPEHQLVTHGPYRWVRHPLYSLAIVLLVSIGIMLDSLPLLIMDAMVTILVFVVVLPPEEAALEKRFGDAYRSYVQRTGAMFPRWRSLS